MTNSNTALTITNVSRSFQVGGERIFALRGVNMQVEHGAFIALMGRSGSGKTTLINMIGGLDQPTEGEIEIEGRKLSGMRQEELTRMRRDTIGFVFQAFALLPILTAAENIEVPLRINGVRSAKERRERVTGALGLVGLDKWANHRPTEMSGGQQQRIAIARALVSRPRLLLADEPTGELDSATGRTILTLLREIVRSEGLTLVMVTHDRTVREFADIVYEMRDGRIVGQEAGSVT